jgi:hypothetical protein
MMAMTVTVKPEDERKLFVHLDEIPTKLMTKLRPVLVQLTNELLRRIRAREPVHTGRLRLETQAFVDEKPGSIIGKVRVVAPRGTTSGSHEAAAALEYGAHRSFRVRAHTMRRDGSLVMIREFQRRADITAKRFMRDPAAEMRPRALAEIKQAIEETKL